MKIAIIGSRGIPAQYGGFETFAEHLSTSLVESGYEVTVYCEKQNNVGKLKEYKGVKLKYLPRISLGPLTTILHDFYALLREAFTSTECVYLLGYGASVFGFITRLRGQKLVINMDGVEWQREKWNYFPAKRWWMLMEWVAVRIASHVIADSNSIKLFLLNRHKISSNKIEVIEYGADIEMLEKYPITISDRVVEPYFLVVARIEPENSVREIVEGFVKSDITASLKVVGNYNANAYGRFLKKNYSDCLNIEFTGAIYDKEKLIKLRNGALAHIHGHKVGGTNPSLLEAMASTGIVIAHDNPHNREVLGDKGLYFRGSQSVAEEVVAIMSNSTQVNQALVENTRKRVREYYSWLRINCRYKEYFDTIK